MSRMSRPGGRRSSALTVPPHLAGARPRDARIEDFARRQETRTKRIFVHPEHLGDFDARELLDLVKDEDFALQLGHLVQHFVEQLERRLSLEGFGRAAPFGAELCLVVESIASRAIARLAQ